MKVCIKEELLTKIHMYMQASMEAELVTKLLAGWHGGRVREKFERQLACRQSGEKFAYSLARGRDGKIVFGRLAWKQSWRKRCMLCGMEAELEKKLHAS